MTDCEHIIDEPDGVRIVALLQVQQFVHYLGGRASTIALAIDGSAAPFAGVRTTTLCTDVYRTFAMIFFPDIQVFLLVNCLAIWERQFVGVFDLLPVCRFSNDAHFIHIGNAINMSEVWFLDQLECSHQFQHRDFAFSNHQKVCPCA